MLYCGVENLVVWLPESIVDIIFECRPVFVGVGDIFVDWNWYCTIGIIIVFVGNPYSFFAGVYEHDITIPGKAKIISALSATVRDYYIAVDFPVFEFFRADWISDDDCTGAFFLYVIGCTGVGRLLEFSKNAFAILELFVGLCGVASIFG